VDVNEYLEGLDLAVVGEALRAEEVNGQLLIELSRSESGLLDAFATATDPGRAAELAVGALTLGRQHALRRAVAVLGGGPRATERYSRSPRGSTSDDGDDAALPPAAARAALRFIAGPTQQVAPRKKAKTRKGNLTDKQVKAREKAAAWYGGIFLVIEALIVITGSGSAWLHLVSMLPGTFMMMAGVTALFQT
jgi:hypothetical protein